MVICEWADPLWKQSKPSHSTSWVIPTLSQAEHHTVIFPKEKKGQHAKKKQCLQKYLCMWIGPQFMHVCPNRETVRHYSLSCGDWKHICMEQLLLVTHWRSVGRCRWHSAQRPCLSPTERAGPTLSNGHCTLRTGLCRSNALVHSDQLIWERALLWWRSAGCLIDHGTDHLVWVTLCLCWF